MSNTCIKEQPTLIILQPIRVVSVKRPESRKVKKNLETNPSQPRIRKASNPPPFRHRLGRAELGHAGAEHQRNAPLLEPCRRSGGKQSMRQQIAKNPPACPCPERLSRHLHDRATRPAASPGDGDNRFSPRCIPARARCCAPFTDFILLSHLLLGPQTCSRGLGPSETQCP